MPGGDRRGPNGYGPMTGRGAGYCSGYSVPGYASGGRGRVGYGFGRGFRGGGRQWRGAGYGRWGAPDYYGAPAYAPVPVQPYPELRPEDEVRMLRDQARAMQKEVELVNERIAELEGLGKEDK